MFKNIIFCLVFGVVASSTSMAKWSLSLDEQGRLILVGSQADVLSQQYLALRAWKIVLGEPLPMAAVAPKKIEDDIFSIDITDIVPSRLLPILGKNPLHNGPNCASAAMYATKVSQSLDYLDMEESIDILGNTPLCQILHVVEPQMVDPQILKSSDEFTTSADIFPLPGEIRPGDVLIANYRGVLDHAFVYIGNDLYFEKANSKANTGWTFSSREQVFSSILNQRNAKYMKLLHLRCTPLEHLVQGNSALEILNERIGALQEQRNVYLKTNKVSHNFGNSISQIDEELKIIEKHLEEHGLNQNQEFGVRVLRSYLQQLEYSSSNLSERN